MKPFTALTMQFEIRTVVLQKNYNYTHKFTVEFTSVTYTQVRSMMGKVRYAIFRDWVVNIVAVLFLDVAGSLSSSRPNVSLINRANYHVRGLSSNQYSEDCDTIV